MGKSINVEERLLGMMAVEKRFITEKQLTECLNTIEFFEPDKSLEEIFLGKEYLTKPQIDRLRQQLHASIEIDERSEDRGHKVFGDIVLEQNMADASQLDEALEEQEKYLERGLRVQIGQILYKMGFLTTVQISRLLESQLRKVLYCKNCKKSNVVHNYNSSQIYQCDTCQLDLIEAEIRKKEIPQQVELDEFVDVDDDDGVGTLDILEL